jgi:DNA-binding NarL/FixJ family response regulator
MAADYGFGSALIVPVPAAPGLTRLGVLCLGSWMPGFFEDEGLAAAKIAARPLAAALHEWWLARIRRELIEATAITPLELLLLDYEHRGFGTKRIARVTGWSTSSVDSRFQRLIAKLGVVDRSAAARLAAEYGLL